MTIGNPLGELTFSLTVGAVSALDRQITFSDGVTNDVFQTDCAINAGNSGGPMFNCYGEVIGVATGRYNGSGVDNICFAIPLNIVRPVIEDLIKNGYTTKPYIGVTVTDVSLQMQHAGKPVGALIYSVEEDGAAAAAGIRPNDIVTQINEQPVEGRDDLVRIIAECEVGQTVTLQVYRNGQTFAVDATLGEMIVSVEY
jgi:serine protease Do